MYKIYGLKLKDDNMIKYIGYTSRELEVRLKEHLSVTIYLKHKNGQWLKKYKNEIEIVLLESNIQSHEDVCKKEIFYIKEYNELGYNLNNATFGGDGCVPTEETREKISKALKGRKVSEETKLKQSLAIKGKKLGPRPENVKEKLRNAHLGRKLTDLQKEKIRLSMLGRKQTDETKKKLSLKNKISNKFQSIKIIIDEIEYDSYGEVSRILSIPKGTIHKRCKSVYFPNYVILN